MSPFITLPDFEGNTHTISEHLQLTLDKALFSSKDQWLFQLSGEPGRYIQMDFLLGSKLCKYSLSKIQTQLLNICMILNQERQKSQQCNQQTLSGS